MIFGKCNVPCRISILYASIIAQAMLLGCPANVGAADIQAIIHDSGSYRVLVIEGKIEPGDFKKFIKIIRDNQGRISSVYVYTSGGDFDEAMKIGRAMRELELGSHVPMRDESSGRPVCGNYFLGSDTTPEPKDPNNCTCASAGFFIHIGGVHRSGTFIAVHRPYFEKGRFGDLAEAEAKKEFEALQDRARNYMSEMGVPKHIQEDVLGTPSERTLILDEKTVKTYFWGKLPYRHEWFKNKCSQLSEEEEARLEGYSQRNWLAITNTIDAGFSEAGQADYSALHKKQVEEVFCTASLEKQSNLAAYGKYFGVKPSDYANHNFSKWVEASKYLGRSFDDILSEERFVEEKLFKDGWTTLNRDATASAPLVQLFDSTSNARIVAKVIVLSTPEPSQEFIQQVNKILGDTWGMPSGGNGSNEWLWEKDGFKAKLQYEPVSAEGGFLSLQIDTR